MSAAAATELVCDGCRRRRFSATGSPRAVRAAAVVHGWVFHWPDDLCPDCADAGEEVAS